ncbi:hypothetical protein K4F52_009318 [Lecanicillium sp. MT-2017a]|nr:hypothetical protein K4F52_009318 [Lecanicillium sp. MT-2017a]
MQNIADKAEEIERQRRKEFILNMTIGILFFIPFIGEAAAGLAAARGLIHLIGEISDSSSDNDAFSAIFRYLIGKGAFSNSKGGKAARNRRKLKDGEFKDVKAIKADIDVMHDVRKKTCSL